MPLRTKFSGEAYNANFSFLGKVPIGQSISSAVAVCTVVSGVDPNPSAMIGAINLISNQGVTVGLQGGVAGVTYNISVRATTNAPAKVLQIDQTLAVKGSIVYPPAVTPFTFTILSAAILSDGSVGFVKGVAGAISSNTSAQIDVRRFTVTPLGTVIFEAAFLDDTVYLPGNALPDLRVVVGGTTYTLSMTPSNALQIENFGYNRFRTRWTWTGAPYVLTPTTLYNSAVGMPPIVPSLSGTLNITTGNDLLPPFYTGRGLYYTDGTVPQAPPVSGTLNSNTTGRMFGPIVDVQFSAGITFLANVTLLDTIPRPQNFFTSLNIGGGLIIVTSASASPFVQTNLGTGYWTTMWSMPIGSVAFPLGTYNWVFS